MLAIAAAVLFFIAFVLHVADIGEGDWPSALLYLGLTLLALHLSPAIAARLDRRRV
jgi:hypothetical protein